jgi:DNA-binding FrmR family transcriptional regulator
MDSSKMIHRLRRIEGQVRGIQKMVEDGEDCEKILQQFSAARSALFGAAVSYLSSEISRCIGVKGEDGQDEKLERILSSLSRLD